MYSIIITTFTRYHVADFDPTQVPSSERTIFELSNVTLPEAIRGMSGILRSWQKCKDVDASFSVWDTVLYDDQDVVVYATANISRIDDNGLKSLSYNESLHVEALLHS